MSEFSDYTQDDFLYRRLGPWPQPSPDHPQGKAPAVVHIPKEEQRRWNRRIGARYVSYLLTKMPQAIWRTLRNRRYDDLSNDAFEELMLNGIYTRFLIPTLDPVDEANFAPLLDDGGPDTRWWKIDFTPMGGVQPLQGMYVAPSVVLVRQEGEEGPMRIVGVYLLDQALLLEPTDPAYQLAKYFVMQAAAYGILFTVHPNLHFPFDSVNAITKTALPTSHPIFQLLEPHMAFQLALNNAVLNNPGSVISEHPERVIYAPFTARASKGMMSFFIAGYAGIPGNSAYPRYDYVERPLKAEGSYAAFLDSYYAPFETFARAVCEQVEPGDELVKAWARHIQYWIPGFAGGKPIFSEPDLLPSVLAGFLWDVTVAHATDHQTFGHDIGVYQHCLRLRVPPPTRKDETFDPKDLVRGFDILRAHLAEMMFFVPYNLTTLMNTRYAFTELPLRQAADRFKEELRAVEARLSSEGIPRYMALDEISASIQY